MSSGRVLAFDFGIHHIGVASGNETVGSVQALQSLKANNGIPSEREVEDLFSEWQPDYIVVGLPVNMDGTADPQMTPRARKFGHRLMSRYGLRVYFKDERLSSVQAKDEIFSHQGGYRALVRNKGRIDATAARIILEGFFDMGGRSSECAFSDPVHLASKAKPQT